MIILYLLEDQTPRLAPIHCSTLKNVLIDMRDDVENQIQFVIFFPPASVVVLAVC